MEKCKRKLEQVYLNPQDKYDRSLNTRTDRCASLRELGVLGEWECMDCAYTPAESIVVRRPDLPVDRPAYVWEKVRQ